MHAYVIGKQLLKGNTQGNLSRKQLLTLFFFPGVYETSAGGILVFSMTSIGAATAPQGEGQVDLAPFKHQG